MAKDTKNAVTIDNVEYNIDEFSDRAKGLLEHVIDLERKVRTANFNLVQLQAGLNTFVAELKAEINKSE